MHSLDQLVEHAGVILVADDDLSVGGSLKEIFELAGHHVVMAGDGAQALKALGEHDVDVLFLDMNMPMHDGWTVLQHLGDRPRPVVIIYSGTEFTPSEMRQLHEARPIGIIWSGEVERPERPTI